MRIVIALVVLTGSCGAPRTPEEFRQGVREGRGTTKHIQLTVDRAFSDVFADVKAKAEICFNQANVHSKGHGMQTRTTPHFLSSEMNRHGDGSGELVIKKNDEFQLVADLRGTSSNQCELEIYGLSWGWDEVFAAIESWARGSDVGCP